MPWIKPATFEPPHRKGDIMNTNACQNDPAIMPLLLRWEGKHVIVDVRDYGGQMRLAITGHASWRKWSLCKMVRGRQLWLIKYIVRMLAALEQKETT